MIHCSFSCGHFVHEIVCPGPKYFFVLSVSMCQGRTANALQDDVLTSDDLHHLRHIRYRRHVLSWSRGIFQEVPSIIVALFFTFVDTLLSSFLFFMSRHASTHWYSDVVSFDGVCVCALSGLRVKRCSLWSISLCSFLWMLKLSFVHYVGRVFSCGMFLNIRCFVVLVFTSSVCSVGL